MQTLEQVLADPELTSDRFREWKEANTPLLQDICQSHGPQRAAEEHAPAAAAAIYVPLVETSL